MGRLCNSLLQRFGKDPREVVAKKKHGGEVELAEGCSDKRKYVQRRGGSSVFNTVHGGWLTEKRAGEARGGRDKEEHGRRARGGSG